MRIPIQYALSFPEIWQTALEPMNLKSPLSLTFEPPDHARFLSLGLAHEALRRGGTTPAAMNAANEVAVQAFLDGTISFPAITQVVSEVVEKHRSVDASALGEVLAADRGAREQAEAACRVRAKR